MSSIMLRKLRLRQKKKKNVLKETNGKNWMFCVEKEGEKTFNGQYGCKKT